MIFKINFGRYLAVWLGFIAGSLIGHSQIAVSSVYNETFNNIGTSLPAGWAVWTNSTTTGNGSAFDWNTAQVANSATALADSYFRNVPGAGQTWSANLSTGSDRALGWRGDSAAARDGSITLTFASTSGWAFNSLSFNLFTPNSAGSAATFIFEYQLGASGTFIAFAGKSYTTDTAQSPLIVTTLSLSPSELSVLNNQSQQVTLRLNNIATTGTAWNSVALDNFAYTASAIPEPLACGLAGGVGAIGLVVFRRLRQSRTDKSDRAG